MSERESELLFKGPCKLCGSSDARAVYDDGHTYCFACPEDLAWQKDEDAAEVTTPTTKGKRMADFVSGDYQALGKRKINEETCRKLNYAVGQYSGQKVQIATYYSPDGKTQTGQKIRFPNKDFLFLGDMKASGLYGQHLWRDKGKMVVVVEGEVDCLTVSMLQDNKWPVVSVPNGAAGAAKALKRQLEWLCGFETIVLFFDNDKDGHLAVEECAPLFPPGRCKIASMPDFKDANEALQAGQAKAVIDAIWGAKVFRPDGVINGSEMWDSLTTDDELTDSSTYPWQGVNDITLGLRGGELVTVTAGSGVGKSAVVREIAHHLLREGETVGMLMLEESVKRTAKGLMGIELNRPIHLDLTPWSELDSAEQQARKNAYDVTVGSARLYLYDHFGSTEIENLLNRVRYLAKGCGCRYIILDHLSIVVSGLDDGDERKNIDVAMTKLRTLCQETGICLILVSHLKRPSGDKGHEEGAATSLSQLRGSHSIAQLSDIVIGLERNQQDEQTKDITTLRILKNRFTGETGIATHLLYTKETGRLSECRPEFAQGSSSGDADGDAF